MKFLLLFLLIGMGSFLTSNVWATGSLICVSEGTPKIEIMASVGHVEGNPLVSDIRVQVGQKSLSIPKNQIVGSWLDPSLVLMRALDENAEKTILFLRYEKTAPAKNFLKLGGRVVVKRKNVRCDIE